MPRLPEVGNCILDLVMLEESFFFFSFAAVLTCFYGSNAGYSMIPCYPNRQSPN